MELPKADNNEGEKMTPSGYLENSKGHNEQLNLFSVNSAEKSG
jgi:hypothetical protein